MKKIIALLLALLLVLSMAVPAFAVTPKLEPPKVSVPRITVKVDLTESFRTYWARNPLKLDIKLPIK